MSACGGREHGLRCVLYCCSAGCELLTQKSCAPPAAALLCLNEARVGGESLWASSWTGERGGISCVGAVHLDCPMPCCSCRPVLAGAAAPTHTARGCQPLSTQNWSVAIAVHNEFLQRRPDLAPLLTENWYFDRKGEVPVGKKPFFAIPVFNYHKVGSVGCMDVAAHTAAARTLIPLPSTMSCSPAGQSDGQLVVKLLSAEPEA